MKKIILVALIFSFSFADINSSNTQNEATYQPANSISIPMNSSIVSEDNLSEKNNSNILIKDANQTKGIEKQIEFSFLSLYSNAHIVVKVVIYILCFFSIVTWTIFFYKFFHFKILFQRAKKQRIILKETKSLKNVSLGLKNITSFFIDEINDEIEKSFIEDSDLKQRVRFRLESQINKLKHISKSSLSPLATIGSSAPFIGLFGTVWGIMNSFIGIANAKNVSLNVVAPGIAEALFATALGLVAAIPAVILYNYFTKLSNKYALFITHIASDLIVVADRDISYEKKSIK